MSNEQTWSVNQQQIFRTVARAIFTVTESSKHSLIHRVKDEDRHMVVASWIMDQQIN